MFGAGAALLLQVAHPTVAAGVREHSDFKEDPGAGCLRTLDYVHMLVYGGPTNAIGTGRAMRAMHQRIKGTSRPTAGATTRWSPWPTHGSTRRWQRRSSARTSASAARSRPTSGPVLGRMARARAPAGIREGDLPETWAGFRDYVEEMCATKLEPSDVVDDVLESLADPKAPDVRGLGWRAWKAMTLPTSHTMRLATIGLLPETARRALDLEWTRANELELNAIGRVSRAATPVMPRSLRVVGPGYLRWRRDAIAGGPFGGAA